MRTYWQLVVWFVLSLGFAYLPFWFQRKLIFGAHIPLCVLAAISFDLLLTKFSSPASRKLALAVAVVVFVPLLVVTPIYLLVTGRKEVRENSDGAYFISNQVVAL